MTTDFQNLIVMRAAARDARALLEAYRRGVPHAVLDIRVVHASEMLEKALGDTAPIPVAEPKDEGHGP